MTREELIEKYGFPMHAILDAILKKSIMALTYVSTFSKSPMLPGKILETQAPTMSPVRPPTRSQSSFPILSSARLPTLSVPRPASSPEKCQFGVCPTIVEDDEPMEPITSGPISTSSAKSCAENNKPRTIANVSTSTLARILQPTMASAAKAKSICRPASNEKSANKLPKSYVTASNAPSRLIRSRRGVVTRQNVNKTSSRDRNSQLDDHTNISKTGMRINTENDTTGARVAKGSMTTTTRNTRRPNNHTMFVSKAISHAPNIAEATVMCQSSSTGPIPKVYLHPNNERPTKRRTPTNTWGSNSIGPVPQENFQTTVAEISAKRRMSTTSEVSECDSVANAKVYGSNMAAANTLETRERSGRIANANIEVSHMASASTRVSNERARTVASTKVDTNLSNVTQRTVTTHLSARIANAKAGAKAKVLDMTLTNMLGSRINERESSKMRVSTDVNAPRPGPNEHTGLNRSKRINVRSMVETTVIAHVSRDSGKALNATVKAHVPTPTGAVNINVNSNSGITGTSVLDVPREYCELKPKIPSGSNHKNIPGSLENAVQSRHAPNVGSIDPIKRQFSMETVTPKGHVSGAKPVNIQPEVHPRPKQNNLVSAQTGLISSAHTTPAIRKGHECTNHSELDMDEVTCEINSSYVENWAHTSELEAIATKQQHVDVSRAFKEIPPVNLKALFRTI